MSSKPSQDDSAVSETEASSEADNSPQAALTASSADGSGGSATGGAETKRPLPRTVRASSAMLGQASRPNIKIKTLKSAAVILDLGEAYTKCGFAGEVHPRFFVPTRFRKPNGQKVISVFSRGKNKMKVKEWVLILTPFINKLYFHYLQVNPKDRKTIICENPYTPLNFKFAIVQILLDMGVPGLLFLPNAYLPLYALRSSNEDLKSQLDPAKDRDALIIDIGFGETRIQPVVASHPSQQALLVKPLGMRDILERFRDLLYEECDQKQYPTRESFDLLVPDPIVEDMVVRSAFVRPIEFNDKKQSVPSIKYAINETTYITIPGKARYDAGEALFGENQCMLSIAELVLDSVRKCELDARARVIRKLLLAGGTVNLPGFMRRLYDELIYLIENHPRYTVFKALKNEINFVKSCFPSNSLAWVAGSLIGSLEVEESMYFTKKKYDKRKQLRTEWSQYQQLFQGLVPDWAFPSSTESESDEQQPSSNKSQPLQRISAAAEKDEVRTY